MSRRKTSPAVLFVLLAVVVSLAAPPAANAIELHPGESDGIRVTKGEYEQLFGHNLKAYGSPLTIAAAAFRSDGINPDWLYQSNLDMLSGSNLGNAFAVAPVYLPNGATVSYFMAAVHDGIGTTGPCGDPTQRNVSVYLVRVDNTTGELATMSYLESAGQDADPQYLLDSSVDDATVAYPDYAYYAIVKLCHTAQVLYTLQILYSMP